MSERSVSENRKLWEAAEKAAEKAVAEAKEKSAEEKRKQKKRVVKLGLMSILVALVLILASVAWFASNRENSAGGMAVQAAETDFMIEPLSNGNNIYQDYHDEVKSSDALIWAMTTDRNMENYDEDTDKGIKPGSSGKISFYVKPGGTSVDLDLVFQITGYRCTETTDENTNETHIQMTAVEQDLQRYLAGHIFLFGGRTEITDQQTGKKSYIYSEPIVSTGGFTKVLENKTYTKANENTPVNIYWVWPKTLSTLVNATSNANVDIEPFCADSDAADSDYKLVVGNILAHPTFYFYNYTPEEGTTLTENLIVREYEAYSDKFDGADNAIGMRINYITLKLTAEKSSGGA